MHRTMPCLAALALAAALPACTAVSQRPAGSMPPLGSGQPPGHVAVTATVGPHGEAVPWTMQPPGGPARPPEPSSTVAYRGVLSRARIGMAIPFTGDADQDFVGNMVPHQEAGIDLAEVELKYGRNPEVLRLARRIIRENRRENDAMNAWLRRHPVVQR